MHEKIQQLTSFAAAVLECDEDILDSDNNNTQIDIN